MRKIYALDGLWLIITTIIIIIIIIVIASSSSSSSLFSSWSTWSSISLSSSTFVLPLSPLVPLFHGCTPVSLFPPCAPLFPCSTPLPLIYTPKGSSRIHATLCVGASVSCACESRIRCEDESGSQCSGESLSCMQMSPLAWDEELTSVKWNNHRGHITTSPWSHHSSKTTRHHITASAQICPRSLLHRPCQESSNRTLVRRSSQEVSYIALANRTLVELARSFTGILPQDLV